MPFFSTAIWPSLGALHDRVYAVVNPLNFGVDQDVIAIHANLSAGATLIGVDRYWVLRLKFTHATGIICQRLESSSTNTFPGTLRNEVCSPLGSFGSNVDLTVWVVTWMASLLPGLSAPGQPVTVEPPPSTAVVTSLPATDPVVMHPGGSDPVSTAEPQDDAGVNGVFVLWQDATGREWGQWFYADGWENGLALAAAIANLSRALQVVAFAGPVVQVTGSPSTAAYSRLRDTGVLQVEVEGGPDQLVVPAVRSDVLLPNTRTFDPANGAYTGLAALLPHLWSRASMAYATGLLGGVRAPLDVTDEHGGSLAP